MDGILIGTCLNMTSSTGAYHRLSRFSNNARSCSRKTVARWPMRIGVSRWALTMVMSHTL